MAAVGVLALQGSFNEHIAGTFFLHKPVFVSVFWCLFSYSKTSLCVLTALARLGVKGMEIRKPEQLQNVTSLIIPGGESTTMAKLAEFHNLVSTRFFFSFFFVDLFIDYINGICFLSDGPFHFLIAVSCFTWVCSNGKACMGDLCRSYLLGEQGNWWVFLSLLLFLYPVWISLFKLMPLGFCFQYKMTDVIIFLQVRKLEDKNWLVA